LVFLGFYCGFVFLVLLIWAGKISGFPQKEKSNSPRSTTPAPRPILCDSANLSDLRICVIRVHPVDRGASVQLEEIKDEGYNCALLILGEHELVEDYRPIIKEGHDLGLYSLIHVNIH